MRAGFIAVCFWVGGDRCREIWPVQVVKLFHGGAEVGSGLGRGLRPVRWSHDGLFSLTYTMHSSTSLLSHSQFRVKHAKFRVTSTKQNLVRKSQSTSIGIRSLKLY